MFRTRVSGSFLMAALAVLLTATAASAQADTVPEAKLSGGITIHGEVGGEAHDGYVIHVRKGQTLTVTLGWKSADDARAEFTVSESADFFSASPVDFGQTSTNGQRWTGVAPATRDYYVYVVAHPVATYSLRATVRSPHPVRRSAIRR